MTAKVELKQTLKVGDEIEFYGEKRKVTQLLGRRAIGRRRRAVTPAR
jgi:hypothetical protein